MMNTNITKEMIIVVLVVSKNNMHNIYLSHLVYHASHTLAQTQQPPRTQPSIINFNIELYKYLNIK